LIIANLTQQYDLKIELVILCLNRHYKSA